MAESRALVLAFSTKPKELSLTEKRHLRFSWGVVLCTTKKSVLL